MNETKIKKIQEKFQQNLSKEEILETLYQALSDLFDYSGISIYLLDPLTSLIETNYPLQNNWLLPEDEKNWLLKRTRELLIGNNFDDNIEQNNAISDQNFIYLKNRKNCLFSNKLQLLKDIEKYQFNCEDNLYWIMISEEEIILGIVVMNNWKNKTLLISDPLFLQNIEIMRSIISQATTAIDNLLMNKKIESLLTDKKQMKERIQREEEDLKNRILELSVLYDTSNSMGHSINNYQIISLLQDAIYKVLKADVCTIFLMEYPGGEIFLRENNPVSEEIRRSIQNNILAVMKSFIKQDIERSKVNFTTEQVFEKSLDNLEDTYIKSFVNVPLLFKDDILGMLNVCSTTLNAFTKNELTFLHTIANQLSLNIGRLRVVKALEKSKIGTMVASMAEGVIMLDENNHLETINPAARTMLNFSLTENISTDQLIEKLSELDLLSLYYEAISKDENVLNNEILFKDKILSANVTPVMDSATNKRIGMVIVLRDVTELQKINKIKTQRLEIISRVNLIINSITDLDNLLTVLMEFVLSIANAEMGSIQLKEESVFHTKIHSNFPNKISKEYKFNTGEAISDYVISKKELVFIDDYQHNESVNQKTKILIDYYLGIPIIIKNELIGVVNIVKKKEGDVTSEITLDDIQTLTTITSLTGTALYNALLYQETLKKEKMDQELRVAHEIQNRLLPQTLPKMEKLSFGAISIPAHAIGGDYYDFINLDSGNIGIIIADIVGKGVPAALLMVMVKSIMQSNIRHLDSPKAAMKKMNQILCDDPVFNKYVPIFYIILNPKKLSFKFCNAGHEPAILFSQGEFKMLDTEGFPLGAWEDSEYEEKEIKLKDGDILAMFTDGITEARNSLGEYYGLDRLKELIKKFKTLKASDIIENIYHKIEEFSNIAELHDDLTMIIVKGEFDLSKIDQYEHVKETHEIKVLSSKKQIAIIRNEVEKIAKKMEFPEDEIFNIKLAINEAQANIIEHAYQGDEKGEILFKFFSYEDRLEIMIKDYGKGMDSKTIKEDEKHLDELEGSGLGLFLINQLMDKVDYKRTEKIGTELWLTKYLNK